ncbi:hypothetical protein [Alcaligenes faecalis]|uniref:hypothetical protein n=1 Tax=Alcaligenes faecalis TaxID=511 RepID=UPI001F0D9963|nr:hypothetical protein [Alcaligenes faecalis]
MLQQVVTAGKSQEEVFRDGNLVGVFLEDPVAVDLVRCIAHKTAVTKVRARLVASLSPPPMIDLPAPSIASAAPTTLITPSPTETLDTPPAATGAAPVVFDPITVRHGKKQFSALFESYKGNRNWGEAQTQCMTIEAKLFSDVMGDPELGEIECETVEEYVRRLAQLPNDLCQSRRRFKTDDIDEKDKSLKTINSLGVFSLPHRLVQLGYQNIFKGFGRLVTSGYSRSSDVIRSKVTAGQPVLGSINGSWVER